MADRPRPFNDEIYRSFCSDLGPGKYSFTTAKEELEGPAARFAQSASTNNEFAGLLTMSSTSSASPQRIGGVQPRPGSRVVSVRRVRPDHGSSEFHVNVDDALIFEDEDRNAWIHSPVSRDAGLVGYLRSCGLEDVPPRGSIDDLRERGVFVSFTT